MPNAPMTEAELKIFEVDLKKREEKLKEQETKLDEQIKNLTDGLDKEREKFEGDVEMTKEELKIREDAVELREKDVEKVEGSKPGKVEHTRGPSINVLSASGSIVRTYSEAVHGKDFKAHAEEFTKKNKAKGYKLKV